MTCEHPRLRSGNTFDKIRVVEPCLYCERDALAARLAEAENMNAKAEKIALMLAEAERLLANNEPLLPPKERREIQEFLRLTVSASGGE